MIVPQFLQRIGWRDGKVSLSVSDPRVVVGRCRVARLPGPLTTFDTIERFVFVLPVVHAVEDEEFDPRPDESLVGETERLHVVCCFSSNIARILGIVFACDRVLDIGQDRQRARLVGVDKGGFGLRHDEDVAFVDRLPSLQAGSTDPQPILERRFCQGIDGDREVFLGTGKVHEPQVNGSDLAFAAQCQDFTWCHAVVSMLPTGRRG